MFQKLFKRFVSTIMALLLLAQLLPPQTFAAALSGSEQENSAAPTEQAPVTVVGENEALRTAGVKHFHLSDGSSVAVSYGTAVHYQDGNGQWKEIDNRPVLNADRTAYAARNGDRITAYSSDLSTGRLLSTGYGNVTVSMGILDSAQAQSLISGQLQADSQAQLVTGALTFDRSASAVVVQDAWSAARGAETDASSQGWTVEDLIPEGLSASVLYENVFPGVDLQYTAYSHDIKEQIIVKHAQSAYRYDFFLELSGLTATYNQDGSVSLNDVSGKEIYSIPAPYMEDSGGAVSTAVSYTVTQVTGGVVLTVIADKDWIEAEDRVFPVRIDPTLSMSTGNDNNEIYAAFAMEAAPNDETMDWQTIYIGNMPYNTNRGRYRLFMHFEELPEVPKGSIITNATLRMYCKEFPSRNLTQLPLAAYDVTTEKPAAYADHHDWFSAITWNNQPSWDGTNAYDYAIGSSAVGDRYWDLTDAAKSWYFEGEDPTIAILAQDEDILTTSVYGSVGFYAYGVSHPPVLTVTYRSDLGLESYYSYTPVSAGRAGSGYINNYTGNLVWTRGDLGFGGNRMPVSISHVYNANDTGHNDFGMGYGWRTNFNQRIYAWTGQTGFYVWEDSDGTHHYFYESGTNEYTDEDGLQLTLTIPNSTEGKYKLTDKYGNASWFDTMGRLVKQTDNQKTPSSITVAYVNTTEYRISTVKDGVGRLYQFTYTGSGDSARLTKLEYKGTGSTAVSTVSYAYQLVNSTEPLLTTFTDKDGKASGFSYNTANKLLTAVQDLGDYKLQFAYHVTEFGNSRVSSVKEYDGSTAGGELSLAYAHNETVLTDVSGNVQILQFNDWGNPVAVQDGEGRAQFAQYGRSVDDPNSDTQGNQLTLSSKLQNTVGNVIGYSSFEAGNGWTAISTAVSVAAASGTAFHGSKALVLTRASAGTASGAKATFTVPKGETYTFSAYVKTGTGATAYLEMTDGTVTKTGETLAAEQDWTRLEVHYTNPSTTASKTVTVKLLTATAGTVYMDCVQIEEAPTASRYNLVENGDFRQSTGWSYTAGASRNSTTNPTPAAPQLNGAFCEMVGDPLATVRATQTVAVSGNSGDVFAFGGWAKGDSVPLAPETRQFGILATFNYTDGTTKTFTARFNPDAHSSGHWQYAASAMVAEKAYSSITVALAYDYNVNTVWFDGIQLYRERFGSSYTYDKKGNVTAVVDIQGGVTEYTIDSATQNITAIKLPDGSITTYVYDGYHNVTKATTASGLVYELAYDAYGNNTSVKVGGSLEAKAEYTGNGNYLTSTTDTVGNETEYSYNTQTGVLESVKYPKDTDTTKTEYQYDTLYRLAEAKAVTDTGKTLVASYTYTNDLLTKLQTGSTTYNFSYGNFDLRSGISIGSTSLASYSYTSRTHYLSTLTYGNADKVTYTYDQQGRVTKETYEDGDTVAYAYDNSGALATVTDSATGRTATYYYDFTDRLMKYVESGTGHSLSVGYTYDTENMLTQLVETINGVTRTASYSYDADNRISSVNHTTKIGSTDYALYEQYSYDEYGRMEGKWTEGGVYGYSYTETASGQPTNQVALFMLYISGVGLSYLDYTYDANGNITSVSDRTNTTYYTYDSANQLIREDNQAAQKTWVWTYDDAGNIVSRTEYAYTRSAVSGGTPVSYTYGNSGWGDLLTKYGSANISYDAIGNMTSDGTWTYTWEHGRQLASMSKTGANWSFTYDANGIRTKRTNGSTTYSYVYNGSQLAQMTVGSNTLYFYYDATGTPMTIIYNGTAYGVKTNLQGDVIALFTAEDDYVVQYTYDAWGRLLSVTDTTNTSLGTLNPLRYRGYVYDTETGLYYLQSRYYNPAMGRFINADAFVSTGQGLLGNNMFAYCTNNPVNCIDKNGKDPTAIPSLITPLIVLPLIDGPLPVGDLIFVGTVAILGVAAAVEDSTPDAGFDAADVVHGYPSPNNDDDDDDDDYYDDESNFLGRQKIGKNKGNTPRNNQAQNKQFRDATKNIFDKDKKRLLHDEISGEGYGFHEIVDAIKNVWFFFVDIFSFDDSE